MGGRQFISTMAENDRTKEHACHGVIVIVKYYKINAAIK